MNVMKKELTLLWWTLIALVIAFLCTHSPNLEYDTPSYITFGMNRPPLYPFFIWLFHWAGRYQFLFIMWTQGGILLGALYYARYWLRARLHLTDVAIYMVFICTIFTIAMHYQINFIQAEGLAFPLFIATFFLLVECFQKFSLKKIGWLAFAVSVLILLRLQFYYLYFVFLLLSLWHCWQRVPIKQWMLSVAILLSSMLLTVFIDHTYHYFKHGFFGGAPYGGVLVMVQTLYLADHTAESAFQNSQEKALMRRMLAKRDLLKLNQDVPLQNIMQPSALQLAYQAYAKNYLALQAIITETLPADAIQAGRIAIEMDKMLILHQPKQNILFFLWKYVKCMGGIPIFLFFLILLLVGIYNMVSQAGSSAVGIFIGLSTSITFLNAATIAVCNPDLSMYFCYTQFLLYCLAACVISHDFN